MDNLPGQPQEKQTNQGPQSSPTPPNQPPVSQSPVVQTVGPTQPGEKKKTIIKIFAALAIFLVLILVSEVASFLLSENGLILHASSCVDSEGRLYVFLAPQGGGKTTVSDLISQSKDFEKFSDDSVLTRKIRGKWVFFSPPMVEKYKLPVRRKAKKASIYFVRKSNLASKKEVVDKGKVLRLFLKQLWLRVEKIDKKSFSNALSFVAENDFYILESVLNAKKMREALK